MSTAPDTIPVLLQDGGPGPVEADDPPALIAHVTALQRKGLAVLRAAASAPRTAAGGCVFVRPTLGGPVTPPKTWLPTPPTHVSARILGRQVQIDVTLPPSASSMGCRVEGIAFVVSTGKGGTTTFKNGGGVGDYSLFYRRPDLAGHTVRLIGHLPYSTHPPYHLSVETQTINGVYSAYEQSTLACPAGLHCLSDIQPAEHGLPTPLLPVRGITPALLERSMRQVLAGDSGWVKPTSVTCSTTAACDVAFLDTVLKTRLKLHFAIEGEQRPGCWLGVMTDEQSIPAGQHVTEPPAAAGLGGCVSWLS